MARRMAWPYWFRAESAMIPWPVIAERHLERIRQHQVDVEGRLLERLKSIREKRPTEIQLRWACAKELGVPSEPFVVWRRPRRDKPELVDVQLGRVSGGLALSWGRTAAYVEVECDPIDPTRAVGLLVTRGGIGLRETVGSDAVTGAGGAPVRLVVRCPGGTRALLVNGRSPSVRIEALDQVLEDEAWKPFERVGLPVDDPWPGTSYDTGAQGLFDDPVDPVEAAMRRLRRGGPPLGWFPVTGTGRSAPAWSPPDHGILLKEVRNETLPRIERIYRPALPPFEQHLVVDTSVVDGPTGPGGGSSLPATATLPPLSLLTLPASADPFLALALGFGTAYLEESRFDLPATGGDDLMVTAEYSDLPDRAGPATMAAYVPSSPRHTSTRTPTNVTAVRDGLVAPAVVDGPWRETVRVSWDRPEPSAALGQGTGAALARFDAPTATTAACLLPVRPAGDFRPLLPVPDGPRGDPGFSRTAMVDAAAEIPIGSGGRSPGYPVAWQDVFGVWSRWEDGLHAGDEPPPPRPRIIATTLSARFEGSTLCPATLEVEVALGWEERTPVAVELWSVLFPMTSSTTLPPTTVTPFDDAPTGCFRRDVALTFVGAELVGGPGVEVEHLDASGENVVPAGAAQGEEGRRYRVRVAVPVLDYSATSRWGVALWTSAQLMIGVSSGLSPAPASPALTSAASPVPVAPIPPPLPPGVPMGSALDAQGRSHARVRWSVPAGADLEPDRGVIVWEVAETALRQAVGLPARAPEGTLPGIRLQQLWGSYDALPPDRRRSVFRRLTVLPGTARETDVALPKGSTDIHLFTVTTLSRSGIESAWPAPAAGQDAHEHLQAVAAPRLRRPATPVVRSVVGVAGMVTLSLTAASRVPVREFRVFRTRSEAAARSFESMGPPLAVVPAVPPGAGAVPDPVTGESAYTAEWTGGFGASWDDWLIRAVAVPVDSVPVEAVRGLLSAACEPVLVTVLPDSAPDLAPLVAVPLGTGELMLVTTSTSAPAREVPLGSHRVSAEVSGAAGVAGVAPVALQSVAEGPVAAAAPPAGADPGAVLVRGTRSGGRSPLAVWLTRPDAEQPLDVVVRVVDPLGRLSEQRVTVPAFVAEPPTLDLLDVVAIAGRGVVIRVRSDADVHALPPYVLAVLVQQARLPFPPPPVRVRFELDDVPTRVGPFPSAEIVHALRVTENEPHEYQVLIRALPPMVVTLTMVAPDGARAQVVAEVRP
ncbi:MAG TPA: hypothetical protein VIP77_00865 [Jiangellaceae bacterium]